MLIPTSHKDRLPRGLSYPFGAEWLSGQLAGVPQLADLSICFEDQPGWRASAFRRTLAEGEPYEIVTVSAALPGTVYVYPVRSHLRQPARVALTSHGLPILRAWLTRHYPPDPLRPAGCRVMFAPLDASVFVRERVDHQERDLAV